MVHPAQIAPRLVAAGCAVAWLVVLFGLVPAYLLNYLRLTLEQTAGVMSGALVGAAIGWFAIPLIARPIGWRRTLLGALLGAIVSIQGFRQEGPDLMRLFALLAAVGFFTAATSRLAMDRLVRGS